MLVQYIFFITDALIGLHCTHGVNRTGYLICRYLIEKLKWNPDDAIRGKVHIEYSHNDPLRQSHSNHYFHLRRLTRFKFEYRQQMKQV